MKMPKLSCLPVSLYPDFIAGKLSLSDWAKFARDAGLDAIDVSVLMTRPRTSGFDTGGMPVDTVATYTDFTHPDAAARESAFDQFKVDVETAVALGAAYLRITAGQAHPGLHPRDGIERTLEYFTRAADFAKPSGVGLLFENHSKPGVWQHYDFGAAPENYYPLTERLTGTPIDLLFDTANACFYHQDPVSMLERIFPKVRRIHIADIIRAEHLKPVLIGSGIVPLTAIFQFLKQSNYSGGLAIEEASFTGLAGIRQAVEITRNLWENA